MSAATPATAGPARTRAVGGTGAAERRPREGALGRLHTRQPDGATASSSPSEQSRGVRHWPRGFPHYGLDVHLSEPQHEMRTHSSPRLHTLRTYCIYNNLPALPRTAACLLYTSDAADD